MYIFPDTVTYTLVYAHILYTHACTHVHIYMYAHTHTRTHTHAHTPLVYHKMDKLKLLYYVISRKLCVPSSLSNHCNPSLYHVTTYTTNEFIFKSI